MSALLLLRRYTPLYNTNTDITFKKLFGYEKTWVSCQQHNPWANTTNNHNFVWRVAFRDRVITNELWLPRSQISDHLILLPR